MKKKFTPNGGDAHNHAKQLYAGIFLQFKIHAISGESSHEITSSSLTPLHRYRVVWWVSPLRRFEGVFRYLAPSVVASHLDVTSDGGRASVLLLADDTNTFWSAIVNLHTYGTACPPALGVARSLSVDMDGDVFCNLCFEETGSDTCLSQNSHPLGPYPLFWREAKQDWDSELKRLTVLGRQLESESDGGASFCGVGSESHFNLWLHSARIRCAFAGHTHLPSGSNQLSPEECASKDTRESPNVYCGLGDSCPYAHDVGPSNGGKLVDDLINYFTTPTGQPRTAHVFNECTSAHVPSSLSALGIGKKKESQDVGA
eukprot:Rmarinus@m.23743